MGKPLRIILISIGALATAIVLFLVTVFVANIFFNKSDQARIKPYGQSVSVDGKNMNVLIQGKGEETVVLLPGYGTVAPALDFKLLIDELSPFYKVVAIEPFGYGLSDRTEKERSMENIVSEIHEAVKQLNIDRYILMAHSISGMYSLNYANKYPNEISAFVGIDNSIATLVGMDVELPITKFKLLRKSGLGRLLLKSSGNPYDGLPFDDETKEQLRLFTLRNTYNNTHLNELEHMASSKKEALNLKFPHNLPLLLFVQGDDTVLKDWISLHEEQLKESEQGKLVKLDAGHYLHHTKSKEIAENFRTFMEEVK
ncbi:alpha/beta hydrolase [Paenibacillus sp.]|uniref:alpha/beta hydrolase n=1 Tax=Paenibacillus sp. TaxID=58172 RepID=UPI0028A5F2D0|nr:alpha/beta hydrolase [Paenibacillus sp.]